MNDKTHQPEFLLHKSEERYKLLVEGVRDYAIFMLSPLGHVLSWNEGAKRFKGYTEEEIIGKHFSVFYPEEAKAKKYPEFELEQAKKEGRYEDEGWRIRKDGTSFYALVVITALYDSKRNLLGFSKITRDLTERKEAEEKLAALNVHLESRVKERTEELTQTINELRSINADLDNFIYTASHDLKAPVSNIEGLINTLGEVLHNHRYFNEEVAQLFEMINDSVVRFKNTIEDLATVNESQNSGRDDSSLIDLPAVIKDVTASIDHLIKESQAQIQINVLDLHTFQFSKIHIRSIVFNFMSNAIKYRSPKRPLKIIFSEYLKEGYYILEVTDNGLGIREENLEKVFQLFHRLHTHVEGSGIGLYIVKKIVDNAGGRVEIKSQVDVGTTFRAYLPYQEAS